MTELNQNQLKGTAYENQILELLRHVKPAYLWKHAPETILLENGIIFVSCKAYKSKPAASLEPLVGNTAFSCNRFTNNLLNIYIYCLENYLNYFLSLA